MSAQTGEEPPAERVRMSDVAAYAGVSSSTVSRVLNERSTVDRELAQRVLSAVADLDYQPNRLARNLRRRAGSVWALLISDIENPFFTSLARGVEDVAIEAGFSVVLCNTDEDLEKEGRYIDVALAEQVAGVIVAPASESSDVTALRASGVPAVAIDRSIDGADLDTVLVDSREGAERATRHLLEAGYERVACISGPPRVSTATQRLTGYKEALQAAGRPVEKSLMQRREYRVHGGADAARALFDLSRPPDGLFVANNLMAVGALETLREAGRQVPGDVGVVGFDDSPWARLVSPALTVVAQPTYVMGQTAARLLLQRIEHRKAPPQVVTLPSELRVRASSSDARARRELPFRRS